MALVKVMMMQCDNPNCGERFEHSKEDPAPGYHLGKGFYVLAGGGPIPSIFACHLECIAPAVEEKINEGLR